MLNPTMLRILDERRFVGSREARPMRDVKVGRSRSASPFDVLAAESAGAAPRTSGDEGTTGRLQVPPVELARRALAESIRASESARNAERPLILDIFE